MMYREKTERAYSALQDALHSELEQFGRDCLKEWRLHVADVGPEGAHLDSLLHECVEGSDFVARPWMQSCAATLANAADYAAADTFVEGETSRAHSEALAYAVAMRYACKALGLRLQLPPWPYPFA